MNNALGQLLQPFRELKATRFFAKELSSNDNSKNQIYLAGDFSILNLLPHSEIYQDTSSKASSVRDRSKASVEFYWLTENELHLAPNTKLILYPKYPEVRLSGFLLGCKKAPSKILTKRDPTRVLILATTPGDEIIAQAYEGNSNEAEIVRSAISVGSKIGAFVEIAEKSNDNKSQLLAELTKIYEAGWHRSMKLSGGQLSTYEAPNAGGYTLEALLGIEANSKALPDFLGWEVKQYSVNNFIKFSPKSYVTLMTPEPDGGLYKTDGVPAFLDKYGYPDKKGRPNRINFGGAYNIKKEFHADTGLKLILDGYDTEKLYISDTNGCIALVDKQDNLAASWSFNSILRHWTNKHSKAVFVPSIKRVSPLEYAFGNKIELCQQTDALLFLHALSDGTVNYDPAIKMVRSQNSKENVKRRSQFRIAHKHLNRMYHKAEIKNISSHT